MIRKNPKFVSKNETGSKTETIIKAKSKMLIRLLIIICFLAACGTLFFISADGRGDAQPKNNSVSKAVPEKDNSQTSVSKEDSHGGSLQEKHIEAGENKTVDLMMFMGQSNMAGHGNAAEAPKVPEVAGYEFRPITDPSRLYPVTEPFGAAENKPGAIDDTIEKTGSLVSAFINSYYQKTGVPVVGVSASRGGSTVNTWRLENTVYQDCVQRYQDAVSYLTENGYTIRHRYMVWMQGEGDAGRITGEEYQRSLKIIVQDFISRGIEKCFLIRIGSPEDPGTPGPYDEMIASQTQLCQNNENFILISTKAAGFGKQKLLSDYLHISQQGLNILGEDAGRHMAEYVITGLEPSMYDIAYDNLYVPEQHN